MIFTKKKEEEKFNQKDESIVRNVIEKFDSIENITDEIRYYGSLDVFIYEFKFGLALFKIEDRQDYINDFSSNKRSKINIYVNDRYRDHLLETKQETKNEILSLCINRIEAEKYQRINKKVNTDPKSNEKELKSILKEKTLIIDDTKFNSPEFNSSHSKFADEYHKSLSIQEFIDKFDLTNATTNDRLLILDALNKLKELTILSAKNQINFGMDQTDTMKEILCKKLDEVENTPIIIK